MCCPETNGRGTEQEHHFLIFFLGVPFDRHLGVFLGAVYLAALRGGDGLPKTGWPGQEYIHDREGDDGGGG